jgi:hypothetical protein
MLNLRLVRSPLETTENETILGEYNRLALDRIPLDEFVRWVQDSPAGPAWHAILETDDKRIVGHTCLFPLRTTYGGAHRIPAKSEYSFLHEDFRSQKIRGFETTPRPPFITLLDELFKHCVAQGWGPIFASTPRKNQPFTRRAGLRAVEMPLWECFWILMPGNAAHHTPNITSWQRLAFFGAGVVHRTLWSIASVALPSAHTLRPIPIGMEILEPDVNRLSFFEDAASLQWRYPEGQYVRYELDSAPGDYLIVKRGAQDDFLRVCQWRLRSANSLDSLLIALIRAARADNAMGVRWAVYDDDAISAKIASHMRKIGFLCARRIRIVMIHKKEEQFLARATWRMNDSLFSFHPS